MSRVISKNATFEQLDEYVFNPNGHAIRHGITDRKKNLVILAHDDVSSTPYKKAVAAKGYQWRPSLVLTSKELQPEADFMEIQCVVVGLALPLSVNISPEPVKGLTRRVAVGLEIPAAEYVYEIDDNEEEKRPFFVVMPSISKIQTGVKLFVLADPFDGLCHLFSIGSAQVFYFSEFRDGTTSKANRAYNWNRLANKIALQPARYREDGISSIFEDIEAGPAPEYPNMAVQVGSQRTPRWP